LFTKLKKGFISRGFNEIPQLIKEFSSGYCELEKGERTFFVYISENNETGKIGIDAYVNASKVLGNRQLGKPLHVSWTGPPEKRRILAYGSDDFGKEKDVDKAMKSLNSIEEKIRQNIIKFEKT